ncbi:hypothetical protein UQ42_26495 [Escherichia coli]|nr:hypothetical protein UQ42_26495 [Escherichia coli]
MANAWLRLWHDMPNDPKWRTIARVSGQPIATVMAVYIHLLVSASRNVTKCHGAGSYTHLTLPTNREGEDAGGVWFIQQTPTTNPPLTVRVDRSLQSKNSCMREAAAAAGVIID